MVKIEVKEAFLKTFSNKGDFIWTMENKKDYFYVVRKQNDLNTKELSDNELLKLSAEKLLEKILPYDIDLTIFQKYQKNFEVYARKLIEVYKIKIFIGGFRRVKKSGKTIFLFREFRRMDLYWKGY